MVFLWNCCYPLAPRSVPVLASRCFGSSPPACVGFTCRQVGQIGDSKLAQLETNEMNGKGFESNKDPQHSL